MSATAGAEPTVAFFDAAASVGGRVVWQDVTFAVAPGQFVAVLGPNGVGKSTLVKSALGLIPLTAGRVELLGGPPNERRRHAGYLPQRRSFDERLRIRAVDVVRLGLDGHRWGMPLPKLVGRHARLAEAQVDDAIALVGAGAFAHRPIGELSGGEQQRVLIAQAIVRRPRVLFLDEPLDSLDLPNQAAVAALVASISSATEMSVIMVAHDVNPIAPYLDVVVYLGHGRAATGTPDQVITAPALTALFDTPIDVLVAADGRRIVVGLPEAPAHHVDRHEGLS